MVSREKPWQVRVRLALASLLRDRRTPGLPEPGLLLFGSNANAAGGLPLPPPAVPWYISSGPELVSVDCHHPPARQGQNVGVQRSASVPDSQRLSIGLAHHLNRIGLGPIMNRWFHWASCTIFVLLTAATALSQTPDSFNPGLQSTVNSLAVQGDGKILAAYSGTIVRLNADGSRDTTFEETGCGGVRYPSADSLALQANGQILVGGFFTALGGQARTNIGRLNADGSLDPTFNPGADGEVSHLAVQADGKIMVVGYFTTLGGQTCTNIGRLNSDGTLDLTFNAVLDPGTNGWISSLAVQSDGRILVGFTCLDDQSVSHIARLNPDGRVNATFSPFQRDEYYSETIALAVQADRKILVGGYFTTLGDQPHTNIVRLNADGSLDDTFNAGADGGIYCIAVQADGKLFVGGVFGTLGGQPRSWIGRLNADGSLDPSFNPGADGQGGIDFPGVWCLAVQADGRLLVGGGFRILGGQPRDCIGRFYPTEPANQSLALAGSAITWLRGGSSPEVLWTTFHSSTNGKDWVNVGAGERISGGWQLAGISLPGNANVRARGFAVGGYGNRSDWFVETIIGPPIISGQPVSRTNMADTVATFGVLAGGTEPLSYQWQKNEIKLRNGGNISGATIPTLTLSNVLNADAGGYSVIVSNVFGSVTSAVAALNVIDPVINGQPASQSITPGESVLYRVLAAGTEPLSYQWRKDGYILPHASSSSLLLSNVQTENAGLYDVVVSNSFGSLTSAVAELCVNLAGWDSFNPGPNGSVQSLAVQPDGKVLVGGYFTALGGQNRTNIGRLNSDGSLDLPFTASASGGDDPMVLSLAIEADKKILLGGRFTTLAGQNRKCIGRLRPDGSLDSPFNPSVGGGIQLAVHLDQGYIGDSNHPVVLRHEKPSASYPYISCLAVQADSRIVLGGNFTVLCGATRNHLGRLNADGSLDPSFNPGADAWIDCLALQPDGKILVGGEFTVLAGEARRGFARLNPDGSLDSTFNPNANRLSENYTIYSLAIQADGKILVGGDFLALGSEARSGIARLNADGSVDSTFNPKVSFGGYASVSSFAVATEGEILVGGYFSTLGGQPRSRIGRLHADGTLDRTFNPGADNDVNCLAVEAGGRILVGGSFTTLGSQTRINIGRLNPTEPATQSLALEDSTLTWLRGGSSPEVLWTTFDTSTNGTDWLSSGAGERISGGWQVTGISLPANANVRARGFAAGGYGGTSDWFVEATNGPPVIVSQPSSLTNIAGTVAIFSVQARSVAPLSYQWHKGGLNLANGHYVSGASEGTLTLSNVLSTEAGGYSVVVSSPNGSVTSAVATLTVVNPPSISQPLEKQKVYAGAEATFSLGASGFTALAYEWFFGGTNPIPGQTGSVLVLSNVTAANGGKYRVMVRDEYGLSASSEATLTVALVAAWGDDSFGQIDVPENLTNIVAVSGGDYFSLALREDGRVTLWGDDSYEQMGAISSATGIVAIAAGSFHSLLLQRGGRVSACGRDYEGQVAVPPQLTNAVAIATGYFHSLALTANGTVAAWGDNVFGQTNFPKGLSNVVAISAGDDHCLALKADGRLVAWGDNSFGQTNVSAALTNVVGLAGGGQHSLALLGNGRVVGWGRNHRGQTNVPESLTDAVAIAAGGSHSLALRSDGRVVAWGDNVSGQTNPPVGLIRAWSIAGGSRHSLALAGAGALGIGPSPKRPTWSNEIFSLTIPTVSGRIYRLEYKNALSDRDWTIRDPMPGDGQMMTLQDNRANVRQRFYRVTTW